MYYFSITYVNMILCMIYIKTRLRTCYNLISQKYLNMLHTVVKSIELQRNPVNFKLIRISHFQCENKEDVKGYRDLI